ncbi:SPOSA6832_02952, partial [Sporobolomyces salmonicolor]
MVLLSYATSAASTAGSYAFSAASSYVFRPGASTSARSLPDVPLPAPAPAPSDPAPGKENHPPSSPSPPPLGHSRKLSLRSPAQPRTRLPSSHHAKHAKASVSLETASASTLAVSSSDETVTGGRGEAEELVDRVNEQDDLYEILGVKRKGKTEEIRRAFLARSRVIHPDKLPLYAPATTAFQRLSYAYETLSKPSSRRIYDLGGGRCDLGATGNNSADGLGDETLNGVLRSVINEFLNGDFEMIRVFVTALNEGNPGLNLGDEAVDNLEGAFRRAREVLLAGQRYVRLIRFELIRLYEIQHHLRALSYFDLYGRLRLTLALTRVTLEIPMVLDRAMREEPQPTPSPPRARRRKRKAMDGVDEDEDEDVRDASAEEQHRDGQLERRGLLGTRTRGMLVLTCKVLEKAERWAGTS